MFITGSMGCHQQWKAVAIARVQLGYVQRGSDAAFLFMRPELRRCLCPTLGTRSSHDPQSTFKRGTAFLVELEVLLEQNRLTVSGVFRISFCHAGFMQSGQELFLAKASLTHSQQKLWPQGRLYASRRKP